MSGYLPVAIYLALVIGFAAISLITARLLRPSRPNSSYSKEQNYECGAEPIGTAWVQFPVGFYLVALVFIVFDVEVALLWPWAVVFKEMGAPAFWAFFVFFLLIAIPFLYEWKSGYLDWVRASTGQRRETVLDPSPLSNAAKEWT